VAVKEGVAVWALVAVGEGVEVALGVWEPEAVGVAVLTGVKVAVPETGTGVFVGAGGLLFEGVVGLLLLEQPARRAENIRRGNITQGPRKVTDGDFDNLEFHLIMNPFGYRVG